MWQKKLQEIIEREEREGRVIGGDDASELSRQQELQQRMDIDDSDIVIQGSTTTRISRKQVNRVILLIFNYFIYFRMIKVFLNFISIKKISLFIYFILR